MDNEKWTSVLKNNPVKDGVYYAYTVNFMTGLGEITELKYKENKYMVQKAKKCIPDFAELLHNKSIKQKYPRRNGRWGRKKKEVIRTACLQANFLHGNQGTWLSAAT